MPSDRGTQERPQSAFSKFISFIVMIVFVVVLVWGLRTFVFVPYEIPSGSMEDTIMTGDMVFSEKITYYLGEPQQGDIITFADPNVAGRTLIKRVIAVGGQTVDLQNGHVVVDGQVLDEPYTEGKPSYPLENSKITFPYTVPEGSVWVMGDNRTNSQDSRYFGAIKVSTITGKAVWTYWPLSDIGILQ
jgi:signal peptidase I